MYCVITYVDNTTVCSFIAVSCSQDTTSSSYPESDESHVVIPHFSNVYLSIILQSTPKLLH
jgi:hypothetical protein